MPRPTGAQTYSPAWRSPPDANALSNVWLESNLQIAGGIERDGVAVDVAEAFAIDASVGFKSATALSNLELES